MAPPHQSIDRYYLTITAGEMHPGISRKGLGVLYRY